MGLRPVGQGLTYATQLFGPGMAMGKAKLVKEEEWLTLPYADLRCIE